MPVNLRRITREQMGPSAPEPPGPDDRDSRGRDRRVLLVVVLIIALVGGGWLLVHQMMSDSKLQDCVMSGRKNCAPLEIDSAGR